MRAARATLVVPRPPGAVLALWADLGRWPSFVDGFESVESVEGQWPLPGATLVWRSHPGGRGRVVEVARAGAPEGRIEADVRDERLVGKQTLAVTRVEAGTEVGLELRYELLDPPALAFLVDPLFVRRAIADSLRRTLVRLARELAADAGAA